MSLQMQSAVQVCTHIFKYNLYSYIYVYISIYIRYTYLYTSICIYICVCIYMSNVCVCKYVYVYIDAYRSYGRAGILIIMDVLFTSQAHVFDMYDVYI